MAKINENIEGKKFLAQRKTQLTFYLIILLLSFTFSIYESVSMDPLNFLLFSFPSLLSTFIVTITIIQSLLHWSDYIESSNFLILSFLVTTIFQILIVHMPYSIITGDAVMSLELMMIGGQAVVTAVLFVHNVIISTSNLVITYPSHKEFKNIYLTTLVLYVPIICYASGVVFQLLTLLNLYDYKILGLVVSYLVMLFSPLTKIIYIRYISYVCMIVLGLWLPIQHDFITYVYPMIINSFITNFYFSNLIRDMLIRIVNVKELNDKLCVPKPREYIEI